MIGSWDNPFVDVRLIFHPLDAPFEKLIVILVVVKIFNVHELLCRWINLGFKFSQFEFISPIQNFNRVRVLTKIFNHVHGQHTAPLFLLLSLMFSTPLFEPFLATQVHRRMEDVFL